LMNSRRRMNCPRREPQSSTSSGDEARVHRGEIPLLMSVQGRSRRTDTPDEFVACPLYLR
jgi:hypothetical protein